MISKFCSIFFFFFFFNISFLYVNSFVDICIHKKIYVHNTQISEQIFNITDLKCTSEEMNPHVGPMLLKVGQRKPRETIP